MPRYITFLLYLYEFSLALFNWQYKILTKSAWNDDGDDADADDENQILSTKASKIMFLKIVASFIILITI